MPHPLPRRLAAAGILLAAAVASAQADNVYKWVDRWGGVHYQQTIPSPEAQRTMVLPLEYGQWGANLTAGERAARDAYMADFVRQRDAQLAIEAEDRRARRLEEQRTRDYAPTVAAPRELSWEDRNKIENIERHMGSSFLKPGERKALQRQIDSIRGLPEPAQQERRAYQFGDTLRRTPSGAINVRTGEFMPKAGRGRYLDPSTGKVIPSRSVWDDD
ncbi:uncharacterized protein DUF4124 [Plasticicumulans lactativorans]|uniref:Uncharacterized protein DUF4124 n=1 Tax=Plasticicumulans lactativorans TaxID=1133106 RepID=A0A4R2KYS8_9GAMM|nr:DUF4124 domain-containing protein [Plasticicumulans lactativorans]TCO79244.1 uncharacterized protein DUF4124 [Plasticicumulans lactativorans]